MTKEYLSWIIYDIYETKIILGFHKRRNGENQNLGPNNRTSITPFQWKPDKTNLRSIAVMSPHKQGKYDNYRLQDSQWEPWHRPIISWHTLRDIRPITSSQIIWEFTIVLCEKFNSLLLQFFQENKCTDYVFSMRDHTSGSSTQFQRFARQFRVQVTVLINSGCEKASQL